MTELKYKVGDKVRIKSIDWYNENKASDDEIRCYPTWFGKKQSEWCNKIMTIIFVTQDYYRMSEDKGEYFWVDEMIEGLVEEEDVKDMGEVSDGYHTFNELYEYRLLYNASMFNELAKQNLYDVHKSKRHSDGEIPFGDSNWFIVMAELPTGQISNHYEMKDWDLFDIPEKEIANEWDGHTPKDVAERLRRFLTPKPKYPKTYEECCTILGFHYDHYLTYDDEKDINPTKEEEEFIDLMDTFSRLVICCNAYWKIAGEEMGLGKPWEPDWINDDHESYPAIVTCGGKIIKSSIYTHDNPFAFPTEEMRDAFYENFKELIEECKELL